MNPLKEEQRRKLESLGFTDLAKKIQEMTAMLTDHNRIINEINSSYVHFNKNDQLSRSNTLPEECKDCIAASQQVAYSTFHDCLTQICFGCKKIRSSINK